MQKESKEKLILNFMMEIDSKTTNICSSKFTASNPWFHNRFEKFTSKLNGPMIRNKSEMKYYVTLFETNYIRYKVICVFLLYWSCYDRFRNTINCEELEEMQEYCEAYLLKPMVNEHYRQCRWKHYVEQRLS